MELKTTNLEGRTNLVVLLYVLLFKLFIYPFVLPLIQLIQIPVKEPHVTQTQSVSSLFLTGDDCVFVRKVGKETDEPVMVCDQGKLSICRENPVRNQMLFRLTHLWLAARRKMLKTEFFALTIPVTCLLQDACFTRID